MRHAGPMDKPRRRAAGRPAGPPNVVVEPPVVERAAEPPVPVAPGSMDRAAPESSSPPGLSPVDQAGLQHRRRQRPARQPNDVPDAPIAGAPFREPTLDAPPARSQGQRPPSGQSSGRDDRRRGESPMERSLRALVSTRTTQLPPTVAMRAREVAAPTRADLAAAERDLVIVRRYYVPPAPLSATGKAPDQRSTDKPMADARPPADGRSRAAEGRRGARQPRSGGSN